MTTITRKVIDLNAYIDANGTEGCQWWSSCASCPFAVCRIGEPKARLERARVSHSRIRSCAASHPDWSAQRIGLELGVSDRTVYRALSSSGG